MAGPAVKKGYKSTGFYQHQSLLRTVLDAMAVNTYPGAAAGAPDMADMFGASTPPPTPTPSPSGCTAATIGVTVCSPTPGSTSASPVNFKAAAKSGNPITAMRIYVDGVSAYLTSAASLNTSLSLATGTHSIVVQAWDSTGAAFNTPLTLTVGSGTSTTSGTRTRFSASGLVT